MSYQDTAAPLQIDYDERNDVLRVNGTPYAGALFRAFSMAAPGTWLRIEDRRVRDGMLTVHSVPESVERTFDAIIGRGKA